MNANSILDHSSTYMPHQQEADEEAEESGSQTEAGARYLGRSYPVAFYLLPSGDYRVVIEGKSRISMDGISLDEVIDLALDHINDSDDPFHNIRRAWRIAAAEACATFREINRSECTTIDYEIYDGRGNLVDQGHKVQLRQLLDEYKDK